MANSISAITTKVCGTCNQAKDLSMFSKTKTSPDGHYYRCKLCRKEYYEKNKEKARAKGRKYYEENKEDVRARNSAYYQQNKDKVRIINKAWEQKNKEKVRADKQAYKEQHKGTIDYALRSLLAGAKSRAKINNLPFDLTLEWLETMVVSHCPITLQPLDWTKEQIVNGRHGPSSPSIDKIIPELGYVQSNCAIVSFRGNRIKSDGTIDEFRRMVQYMAAQQLRDTEF